MLPVGLLYTLLDSLNIQWPDTPHVDDLNINSVLPLEDLSSLQTKSNHSRVGDNGDT